MRGEMVPPDIFDLAVKARDDYRKQQRDRPRRSDPARSRRSRTASPRWRCRDGRAAAARNRRAARCSASASPAPVRSFSTSRSGSASSARRSPRARASCSRSPPARSSRTARAPGRRGMFAAAVAACMATILAWGAVAAGHRPSARPARSIGAGIPTWVAQLVLPIGVRADRAAAGLARRPVVVADGRIGAAGHRWSALALMSVPRRCSRTGRAWPGLRDRRRRRRSLGAPIFAILGGAAVLLFMSDGVTPATILIETYSLSVSPTLPAIPLFTLAGFLLAEGQRVGAAAARVPRVVRLDSRRHGRRLRGALLVLHRRSPAGRA